MHSPWDGQGENQGRLHHYPPVGDKGVAVLHQFLRFLKVPTEPDFRAFGHKVSSEVSTSGYNLRGEVLPSERPEGVKI